MHFGNLQLSLLSLFRVVTLEDWTDVMYIQMWGSANYPFSEQDLARHTFHHHPRPLVGALFFVSFVALGTMIMLNLFIGVIINSMDDAQSDRERRERERHVAETGRPTLGDEITLVENQLEVLAQQLRTLRKRADERE